MKIIHKYIFWIIVLISALITILLLSLTHASEEIEIVNPTVYFKIAQIEMRVTCFTQTECPTKICQSGQIKEGEVALNPKWKDMFGDKIEIYGKE